MRRHVQTAQRETRPVIEEATTLFAQKREVETKEELLDAFNQHFIISNEEEELLTSMSAAIDDRFFNSLARQKRIYTECQVLLGSENQQLGLDLMEKSTRILNSAFQKLFRWVQKAFQTLNLENPQLSSFIRRSLRVLVERPTLFQSCLDFFAETRERNLSESFYVALTGSATHTHGLGQTDDPTTKPIEYYAHDPLRFVGGMLAWTHSATVSEREALEVLFISEGDELAKGIKAGRESEPWSQDNIETFDGQRSLAQLVNRDLAGVARTLRQRVEQVIQSDEDPVLAYKIANLIDFYRVTFAKLLGPDSSVLDTLSQLRESALQQYRNNLQDHVNSIRANAGHLTADLAVPNFLDEALIQLRELMKTYDSSLAATTSREVEFQPILAEALDPFLERCEQIAARLEEPSKSIFTINGLTASKVIVSMYGFTSQKLSELDNEIENYASNLIEYQHAYFLHQSGLHPLIVALAPLSDSDEEIKSIVDLEAFKPQALRDASQVLDDFLPSALMDAMENLARLKNARLSEEITAEAANRFCEDFEFVEARLSAVDELRNRESGGEEDEDQESQDGEQPSKSLRALFPRTSGEIKVLLS